MFLSIGQAFCSHDFIKLYNHSKFRNFSVFTKIPIGVQSAEKSENLVKNIVFICLLKRMPLYLYAILFYS